MPSLLRFPLVACEVLLPVEPVLLSRRQLLGPAPLPLAGGLVDSPRHCARRARLGPPARSPAASRHRLGAPPPRPGPPPPGAPPRRAPPPVSPRPPPPPPPAPPGSAPPRAPRSPL